MADDTYVQAIKYEADISDIQRKLDDLGRKQNDTEGKTKESATKMSKHWDGVKDSVGKIAVGVGLLGGAALLMAPKILEGGASLDALDKKAGTVFEGSLGMVDTWAQANAKAMGLTSSQARDAAASVADLLKPMGFSAEAAATMSTDMLNLSGALSAWSGGTKSAVEVSDIMTKAMLGETDGLKALGISISAADVQAQLAANGQDKLTGAALEQAKAQAVQQLIMAKSTDAQKAWADGSMDAVKKQNSTKASIESVKESFTRALYPALQGILPIVSSLADWLGKHLPGAIATLREWVTGAVAWMTAHKEVLMVVAGVIAGLLVSAFIAWATAAATAAAATLAAAAPFIAIGAAIAALAAGLIYAYNHFEIFRNTVNAVRDFIVNSLVPAFQQIWSFISDNIIPIIRTLVEVYIAFMILQFKAVKAVITEVLVPAFMIIYNTILTVATFVGEQVGRIVAFVVGIPIRIAQTVNNLWEGIRTGISGAKDWVGERIDDIVSFATGLPGRMIGVFSGMWDGIKDAFRSAINWVIDKWNSIDFGINVSVPDWVPGVGGKGFKVDDIFPDIPRLHSGGRTPGPSSREMLALLRGNETVRTEQQESALARGGKSIHIAGDLVVNPPTGTAQRFAQELWRVAG